MASKILTKFSLQLMPSPKWKLVVDIGDESESTSVQATNAGSSATTSTATTTTPGATQEKTEQGSGAVQEGTRPNAGSSVSEVTETPAEVSSSVAGLSTQSKRDPRLDEVLSILAEFMPSDAQSSWGPFLPGFMSLRLLLLRQSQSREEHEIVRTMLDSFSSYSANGRQRSDIAVMLARDFLFMSQQQQLQLSIDGSVMAPSQGSNTANSGFPVFGLPSTNSTFQNSPALAPIPVPGTNDSMSVVSNS